MSNDIIENGNSQLALNSPSNTSVAVIGNPANLLQIAIEKGASLEQLEKLMAMQERWEANQAKKAYDRAFSAFKAEAVQITKNRKVDAGPLAGKKYAELYSVVNAVTPALSRHGLSSSWKLTKDDKDWMEVTCFLRHVEGHEESVSMGGPPDTGGAKNAIQARASTKTYLERYTLKAITGLSEQGDDSDGNTPKAAAKKELKHMSANGFKAALASVQDGTYTVSDIKAGNLVTADQEAALTDAEKEAKK